MKRGWWTLTWTATDAENEITELNDCDREHIAEMVKEGFTSGEILQEEEE